MSDEQKSNPVPVRFDPQETDILERVSEATGLPKAQLVRLAVKVFLREADRTVTLPLDVKWEATKDGALLIPKNTPAGKAASNILKKSTRKEKG